MPMLKTFLAFMMMLVPIPDLAAADELLYKICVPKADPTIRKYEECKDEDCGLTDEVKKEPPAPTLEKDLKYTFLGATDYGMMWGSDNYHLIGEDRVRALLYIIPTAVTKTIYSDKEAPAESTFREAFFSTFDRCEPSDPPGAKRRIVVKKETSGGSPVLQMIDLHCKARKMKIYDNNTLYYRMAAGQPRGHECVELLWEKPNAILPWQPVSSLTMDLLTDFYCKK